MINIPVRETFKEVDIGYKLKFRYAVSNFGRIISFSDKIEEGRLLKGSLVDGYRVFRFKIRDEKNKIRDKQLFLYRMVANAFIPKKSEDQVFVLHLDRKRDNDYVKNLKWATREEMLEHSRNSPFVIEAKLKFQQRVRTQGHKLTETDVIWLKRKLFDPNRKTRIRILAKQYGVSEMTLYRIKSGENWGHVKVDIGS